MFLTILELQHIYTYVIQNLFSFFYRFPYSVREHIAYFEWFWIPFWYLQTVATLPRVNRYAYLYHKWPRICSVSVPLVMAILSFPYSWRINGVVIRVTWRRPLVEQDLCTLPEHLVRPEFKWSSFRSCPKITCLHVFSSVLCYYDIV